MDLYSAVNNTTHTMNGATTYKSSLNACLDLFAMGGASRNKSLDELEKLIMNSWKENEVMTLQILFYLRDIRKGVGEKRIFREGIKFLSKNVNIREMLSIIPQIGSWKDVFEIYPIDKIGPYISDLFLAQVRANKYDLLPKWMPSIGGSKNKDAEKLASYCHMTPRDYRKALSRARSSIKIVETPMCKNAWNSIEYEHVPSKAMLNYKNAFKKHDNDRYSEYLNSVKTGEKKINAKTLFPYEITKKYVEQNPHLRYGFGTIRKDIEMDDSLELLWKNLKNYNCDGDALVVADVSGSMYGTPMDVSTSLAIYFAERNTSIFKDTYITFSDNPKFQKLNRNWSLIKKLQFMYRDMDWGGSTNLQSTFDMILDAAIAHNLPENEMPKTLYIISDMEFNDATRDFGCYGSHIPVTNYGAIRKKYKEAGYVMPNIIFWNVNSLQSNVPVTKNDDGVALVSGCSPSIFEMVASNAEEMSPETIMIHAIEPYKEMAEKAII